MTHAAGGSSGVCGVSWLPPGVLSATSIQLALELSSAHHNFAKSLQPANNYNTLQKLTLMVFAYEVCRVVVQSLVIAVRCVILWLFDRELLT